jgi:ribose transport system substrate-binding protein
MEIRNLSNGLRSASRRARFTALATCIILGGICGCSRRTAERIAVIPQTEGTMIWEAAHVGAEEAAQRQSAFIYWNAPTREDDVEAQIAVVDRAVNDRFDGLVLAPDQALALMTPVRHAVASGIPTVVIGSPLAMPPGGDLFYILNDNAQAGRLAAQRVGELLHGTGTVAVLGIDPDLSGIMIRTRAFENALSGDYPGIRILDKRKGSFNIPHEQQVAQDTITSHPDLDVIVAMMAASVEGTLSALHSVTGGEKVKVIGFDVENWPPFERNNSLVCLIQEDTRIMGEQAVELILARREGHSVPVQTTVEPRVITRENMNSPEVRRMLSQDWTLGRAPWSTIQ